MKIIYERDKDEVVELEVSEEFGQAYDKYLQSEKKEYWKIKKRKQRANFKSPISLDYLRTKGVDISDYTDILQTIIDRDEKIKGLPLLKCLTERQKVVVTMHYIDNYSKVEIAALLGVRESTIREILLTAIKRILKSFAIPSI